MKKFVILAMQRTGSNMLVAALNSHPNIMCHGVLLRGKGNIESGEDGIPNLDREEVELIKRLNQEFWNEDYRLKHQLEFLESLADLNPNVDYTGFKLMLDDRYNSAIRQVIEREDYKIILLKRNNILACYSSNEISHLTGQHHAGIEDTIKKAKVEFKLNSFERFLRKRKNKYNYARELLTSAGKDFLEIEYNQLRTQKGLQQVVNFLKISGDLELQISTKKRNSDNILERFTNPTFVDLYVKENGLQHWLVESNSGS
ncbi:MAG: hypothetical protein AAGA80_02845 [Cyanobacteria bacterium P01_F01_bin.143]